MYTMYSAIRPGPAAPRPSTQLSSSGSSSSMSDPNFMINYLKRISDLERPLPADSAIFLPPRPDNPPEVSCDWSTRGHNTQL